jgi:hypothetical protein
MAGDACAVAARRRAPGLARVAPQEEHAAAGRVADGELLPYRPRDHPDGRPGDGTTELVERVVVELRHQQRPPLHRADRPVRKPGRLRVAVRARCALAAQRARSGDPAAGQPKPGVKALSKDLRRRGWSFVGPTTVTPSWRRWGWSATTSTTATSARTSNGNAAPSNDRRQHGTGWREARLPVRNRPQVPPTAGGRSRG